MSLKLNRREFLSALLETGALGAMFKGSSLRALSSAAALTGALDYKAVVYIDLFGGNDSVNVRVPIDTVGYGNYASIRGPLALPKASLIQLAGTNCGLHPSMPNLAALFNSGDAAFVANQGPLVQPVTIEEARQGLFLPSNLMSHPDQQGLSQTGGPSTTRTDGPGGHYADLYAYLGPTNVPMNISVTGQSPSFLQGLYTSPFVAPINPIGVSCAQDHNCQTAKLILGVPSNLNLVQQEQSLQQQMYQYNQAYADAIQNAHSFQTPLPANNGLAYELQQIASVMSVRSVLGASRQIFFAALAGFDFHINQLPRQAALLASLDAGLGFFWSALGELGLRDSVVVIINTEFGRQWLPNPNAGTNHSVGGDLTLVGGALVGGKIYGSEAILQIGGPNDFTGDGRALPTTATCTVIAEVISWMGAAQAQLPSIIPVLANFPNSFLGFLGQANSAPPGALGKATKAPVS